MDWKKRLVDTLKRMYMFNLNQAITEWRQQMAVGGIKTPAVLDELESHLREEIERQMRSGTSERPAFEVAVRKIGPVNALKNEFKKSTAGVILEKCMFATAVFFVAFGIFLSSVTVIFCYLTLGERLVAFTALGFTLLVACGWPGLVPHLPVISHRQKRVGIEVLCLLGGWGLSALFAQTMVHHFETGLDHILPAIGFWCLLPVALGFGFVCGIERSAQRAAGQIMA
jgi:hypothetical protein